MPQNISVVASRNRWFFRAAYTTGVFFWKWRLCSTSIERFFVGQWYNGATRTTDTALRWSNSTIVIEKQDYTAVVTPRCTMHPQIAFHITALLKVMVTPCCSMDATPGLHAADTRDGVNASFFMYRDGHICIFIYAFHIHYVIFPHTVHYICVPYTMQHIEQTPMVSGCCWAATRETMLAQTKNKPAREYSHYSIQVHRPQ